MLFISNLRDVWIKFFLVHLSVFVYWTVHIISIVLLRNKGLKQNTIAEWSLLQRIFCRVFKLREFWIQLLYNVSAPVLYFHQRAIAHFEHRIGMNKTSKAIRTAAAINSRSQGSVRVFNSTRCCFLSLNVTKVSTMNFVWLYQRSII